MPVTLKNLLKIGQLKEHPVSAEETERLLTAAQRNLRDAHIEENSAETRFDVAYKAIMQSAVAAVLDALRRQSNVADSRATMWMFRRRRIAFVKRSNSSRMFWPGARHIGQTCF
jgi:hypothetical protein